MVDTFEMWLLAKAVAFVERRRRERSVHCQIRSLSLILFVSAIGGFACCQCLDRVGWFRSQHSCRLNSPHYPDTASGRPARSVVEVTADDHLLHLHDYHGCLAGPRHPHPGIQRPGNRHRRIGRGEIREPDFLDCRVDMTVQSSVSLIVCNMPVIATALLNLGQHSGGPRLPPSRSVTSNSSNRQISIRYLSLDHVPSSQLSASVLLTEPPMALRHESRLITGVSARPSSVLLKPDPDHPPRI